MSSCSKPTATLSEDDHGMLIDGSKIELEKLSQKTRLFSYISALGFIPPLSL